MEGKLGPFFEEHLDTEYEFTSIVKPIARLLMSLWAWESLVMTLPSDVIL